MGKLICRIKLTKPELLAGKDHPTNKEADSINMFLNVWNFLKSLILDIQSSPDCPDNHWPRKIYITG